MASTYTSRIRLEKQGDGENPNAWGLILNQNVIDLVDEAISGYEIVSVSSVAVSLTAVNGATDQARNFALSFAGTLTSNVTVTFPAQQKVYFVNNATSGDYKIFLKPTGGTAVTATSQGTSTVIATDGSNIKQIAFEEVNTLKVTTSCTIAGTLGVGGVTTLTAALNMGDNHKIRLGDTQDFEIYHNGSDSYLVDTGTGGLNVQASSFNLRNAAGNETALQFIEDGGVDLYHNNSKKLETTSGGVVVTGIVSATSFAGNVTGTVLQVLQSTQGTALGLGTSYATTNLAQAITVASSTNKVLVEFNVYTDTRSDATNGKAVFKLFRGSTDLGYIGSAACDGGRLQTMLSMRYLDTPGSAASHTYTLQAKKENGSVDLHSSDMVSETSKSFITVSELLY
jgi:hypothetical protein